MVTSCSPSPLGKNKTKWEGVQFEIELGVGTWQKDGSIANEGYKTDKQPSCGKWGYQIIVGVGRGGAQGKMKFYLSSPLGCLVDFEFLFFHLFLEKYCFLKFSLRLETIEAFSFKYRSRPSRKWIKQEVDCQMRLPQSSSPYAALCSNQSGSA